MIKNNKKGFTIVELVIVIAVIGILAGVLIPTFAGITQRAEESKALQATRNTLTEYISQNGSANAGLVFYYPLKATEYKVYLYANGALNDIGFITIDESGNYVSNKLVEGVTYEAATGLINFTKTYGSFMFSGTASFERDSTYGEALISKNANCTQVNVDQEFTVTIDNSSPAKLNVSPASVQAKAGDTKTVTVTVVADSGADLANVSVADVDGADVTYSNGTITIKNVTSAVTITVNYTE